VLKYLACILCVFLAVRSIASEPDSLIYFNDLNFVNQSESSAIKSLSAKSNENDLLNILLTPFQKKEGFNARLAQQKIEVAVEVLKEKVKDKSDAKKIKIIHQYLHEHFL
jgi:hypothetical protein